MSGQEEVLKRLAVMEQQIQGSRLVRGDNTEVKPPVSTKMGRVVPKDLPPHQKNPTIEPEIVESNTGNLVASARVGLNIMEVQERWNDVLEQVKKRKKSTQAFLMEGKPFQFSENILTILFREGCSFHKDKVDQTENRQTIEDVLKQFFGTTITLQNFMENEFQTKEMPESQELKRQEQALIDKAKDMFGMDRVVVRE